MPAQPATAMTVAAVVNLALAARSVAAGDGYRPSGIGLESADIPTGTEIRAIPYLAWANRGGRGHAGLDPDGRRHPAMTDADLRERVAAANRAIDAAGLVALAFGNASGVDRAAGVVLIKPSGVPCAEVTSDDLVAVALDDGRVLEGDRRPSTDTPTHRRLYLEFPDIGGVVHTHSTSAAAWAQAGRPIPPLGCFDRVRPVLYVVRVPDRGRGPLRLTYDRNAHWPGQPARALRPNRRDLCSVRRDSLVCRSCSLQSLREKVVLVLFS